MEIRYTTTTRDMAIAKVAAWAFGQCVLKCAPNSGYIIETPEDMLIRFGKNGVYGKASEYQEFIFENTGIQ